MVNDHRDHEIRGPSEERRGHKEPDRDDKDQNATSENPGHAQGQKHLVESPEGGSPQVLCGFEQIAVDPDHHAVKRKDHKGHHDMDHSDRETELIIDQFQRLLYDAQLLKQLVDHTISPQNRDPGVCPNKNAGPEGNEDQDQQEVSLFGPAGTQIVGHRVSDQEANSGHEKADFEGYP